MEGRIKEGRNEESESGSRFSCCHFFQALEFKSIHRNRPGFSLPLLDVERTTGLYKHLVIRKYQIIIAFRGGAYISQQSCSANGENEFSFSSQQAFTEVDVPVCTYSQLVFRRLQYSIYLAELSYTVPCDATKLCQTLRQIECSGNCYHEVGCPSYG